MDAFKNEWWTQAQTIGWIMTRDDATFQMNPDGSPKYETALDLILWHNLAEITTGHSPIRPEPRSIEDEDFPDWIKILPTRHDGDGPLEKSEAALLEMLRTGAIAAKGIRRGARELADLSTADWIGLEFKWKNSRGENHAAPARGEGPEWHALLFPSDRVQELWPAIQEQVEAGEGEGEIQREDGGPSRVKAAPANADIAALDWLREIVLVNPDGPPYGTNRDYYAAQVKEKFGIGARRFRERVWRPAVADAPAWTTPGKKSKKSVPPAN